MERKKNYLEKYLIPVIYILYAVGVIGHLTSSLYDTMITLTPFMLLVTGAFVLFFSIKERSNLLLIWVVVTYIITFSLEVFGVETGLIFGEYHYGESLGIKLLNVPLIIGFNWVMVILGSIGIVKLFSENKKNIIIFAPLFALIFDFLLEPLSSKLDYWHWKEGIIPLQNYAAWYFISLLSVLFFIKLKIKFNIIYSSNYYFVQFLFFLFLSIFL